MLAFVVSAMLGVSAVDSLPIRPISQWNHTQWSDREGAPADAIALAQTADGYLWIGTNSSLVRFDGVRFVPFVQPEGAGALGPGATRLLGARDGSLWIVWAGGRVSRLRRGRLESYGQQDGLFVPDRLAESSTGTLVASTDRGLFQFIDGKWKDVSRAWGFPGTRATNAWYDRDDALWVETEDRLVYLPRGTSRFLDASLRLTGAASTSDFAQASDGTIWLAEPARSAHTVPRGGDHQPITEVQVGAGALLIDRRGSLWVGSLGDGIRRLLEPGLVRGRRIAQFGTDAEHITTADGLLSDVITAMLEDREGNIWIATNRGLDQFREGAFTPFATGGSVRPRNVYAAQDSSVWSAELNQKGFRRFARNHETAVPTDFLAAILLQHPTGELWTVAVSEILRIRGRRFLPIRKGTLNVQRMTSMTVDPAGTVWVYDLDLGLLRLTDTGLERVARLEEPGYEEGMVYSDRKGRIWVVQALRIALYDRGETRYFTEISRGIFEDHGGDIWSYGETGPSRFDGRRFQRLGVKQNVPGRSVFGIAESADGAWWLTTSTGVLRLPPGEIERASADTTGPAVRYRSFGRLDGLPGKFSTTMGGRSIVSAADGLIWVATDSGLASIDPLRLSVPPPPPVVIEGLRIDGHELAASDRLMIPPSSPDLEIDYTSTALSAPARIEFRYQLGGEDHSWRDVGTRRRAYYAGLAPGSYTFRVMAGDGDGVWNETPAEFHFQVLPAWYQTVWFRALVVLLIGGLGAAAAALVQRRRHFLFQQTLRSQYEATLAERARIAQDLHDTLLQGFAGVSLQLKAAELALPSEPTAIAQTLRRVQQLTRDTLREARERVWEMHDTAVTADDLPAALEAIARDRTAGSGTEIALHVAGNRRRLGRVVEDAALRIGREAMTNAVRHAECRRIELHLVFGDATLRLEVRDDGRGFSTDQGEEARRQGHFGLTGMRDRAARVGGKCDVSSQPGGGTVVTLELPLTQPGKH